MSTINTPPPSPPPVIVGRTPWYYYYPIEGIVYDLNLSGDTAILNTNHGVLRYKYTGISVKYLRIPDPRITRLRMVFAGIAFVIIAFLVFSVMMGGFGGLYGASITGFFQLFIALFVVIAVFTAVFLASAWRSKPVLVLIDKAGVEHYYIIDAGSRDKILRIVMSAQ